MMTGKQLKNAILQLAIQGKLVAQDPSDEPTSALLARIRKEKEQLLKAGKLKKKDLETTSITDDEKPFEIPESWEWVRMNDVLDVRDGTHDSPKYHLDGYPLVTSKNLRNNKIDFSTALLISEEDYISISNRSRVDNDDILYAMIGSIGNPVIVKKDRQFAIKNMALFKKINNGMDMNYAFWYLNYQQDEMRKYASGGVQSFVSLGYLRSYLIPLPPLAEQKRIVAKIEELMPLVEEYGAAQEKLDRLNGALPETLKKSILQQAIQGKLVPQDPADEPAAALLARIRKEKEQLLKAGKLKKKDLETTPISDEEKPFEIPESWEWCRLGEIGIFERGNGIKREETFSSGKPCVRYGEMYTKYRYNPTFDKTFSYTSQAVFDKCRKAHNGDLFMALTGENKQDIALAAQYIGKEDIAVGGDLCHFSILQAYALYFVYVINSQFFSDKKELLATGDIIVHISADKLGSIPIPLPPLAEQRRIVARVEELLAMVEGMK